MRKTVLFIFGTRPEAIKMAPLILEMKKQDIFSVKVCVTGQHRQMLDQVMAFFNLQADYDLNLMKPGQTLFDITSGALCGLEKVISEAQPHLIIVQGDTTTAFVGALAGYYKQVKVAHLEAGLRSGNLYSPFPEEGNRKLAGHLTDFHFAPTPEAVMNLKKEGLTRNVFRVGNTVIDALLLGLDIIRQKGEKEYLDFFSFINWNKRIILVTGHRRESFGGPFENMCNAMKQIVTTHPDVEIVYPVHLNPNVREPVNRILKEVPSVHLIEPLDYPYLIWLMNRCYFVLTDSGGIQEEAPSLGKPVLVMREVTERMEGVRAGTARLVGTDPQKIITEVNRLLDSPQAYKKMANSVNPYGDGSTSRQISGILVRILNTNN